MSEDSAGYANPVVVGIDESAASRGALWWAVQEAMLRRRGLLVVHALSPHGPYREQSQRVVTDAVGYARHLAPGLAVEATVGDEPAGRQLCAESRYATLLVVASRGLGGFKGLLIGSVSEHVAARADCPVLVVHHGRNWARPVNANASRLPVVVGVDGGSRHEDTLAFAFEEASMRSVELHAVRGWCYPSTPRTGDPPRPPLSDVAGLETAEGQILGDTVAPWRQKYPSVVVRERLVPLAAAAALVDAGRHAQLVVVGARDGRGRGPHRTATTGQVLHHAPCPVVVVRSGKPAGTL